MARQELNSGDVKVEQMPPIADIDAYEGDIVLVDPEIGKKASKALQAELAFMAEPVTIILQPSAEKNAATVFPIWVNGKPAEVFQRGRWEEIGYLPVGIKLIIRRCVLEVIIRAKVTSVTTLFDKNAEQPDNKVGRFTSPVHSYSILEDANPRGPSWAAEMMRRNY